MHRVSRRLTSKYFQGVRGSETVRRCVQAFGVTEPVSGSDTTSLTTRARRDGDSYIVSGQKVRRVRGWRTVLGDDCPVGWVFVQECVGVGMSELCGAGIRHHPAAIVYASRPPRAQVWTSRAAQSDLMVLLARTANADEVATILGAPLHMPVHLLQSPAPLT